MLTQWIIDAKLAFKNWLRGMNTCSKLKPDGQLGRLMVEYDNETEKRRQVQMQARRYNNSNYTVLWVFQSINRFNWIQDVADASNTLVMIAGGEEFYDLNGNSERVEKLCELT